MGNVTSWKPRADKLCSKKSFYTEVENSWFLCLELNVKQILAFSEVLVFFLS